MTDRSLPVRKGSVRSGPSAACSKAGRADSSIRCATSGSPKRTKFLRSKYFSVPKKFQKRANKRNLQRRRMKEAYRLNKEIFDREEIPSHWISP